MTADCNSLRSEFAPLAGAAVADVRPTGATCFAQAERTPVQQGCGEVSVRAGLPPRTALLPPASAGVWGVGHIDVDHCGRSGACAPPSRRIGGIEYAAASAPNRLLRCKRDRRAGPEAWEVGGLRP